MTRLSIFAIALLTALLCSSNAVDAKQQMEKRKSEEYLAKQFAKSKPAVGELAPDMKLKTLDGRDVALSDYRGKNIVVIKAGYT